MVNGKLTLGGKIKAAVKYAEINLNPRPIHINIEVTKKCNARCSFCDYWKTKEENALEDYTDVVRKFNPFVVSISGGEPLLRGDLADIIRGVRRASYFNYTTIVTNGSLLTVERARELYEAGMNQLSVSLDFPDARHDKLRGLPGLYDHLAETLPEVAKIGFDRVSLNTVIMRDNYSDLVTLARQAYDWGVSISFSSYTARKNGNKRHMIPPEEAGEVAKVVDRLMGLKKELGTGRSANYSLSKIPTYFAKGGIGGCMAGKKWVQITPEGFVKPCSELPVVAHYKDYDFKMAAKTDGCQSCWFACRGESQAPVNLKRLAEFVQRPGNVPATCET